MGDLFRSSERSRLFFTITGCYPKGWGLPRGLTPDNLGWECASCFLKLKLLGVTFEADPVNWDTHIDHVLSKASSRLYILRVCRFYGYPKEQLDLLFQSLIISVFTYAIEVWGCCYYDKYLKRIDKLFARAFKSGYCLKKYSICDILTTRDSKLWNKITSNTTALDDLLPPRRTRHLRSRGHDYILPRVRTSRFKSTFVNRCLFNIVCH